MRFATTVVLVLSLILVCVTAFPLNHPKMVNANALTPPAERTGAPVDGGTCANAGCHVSTQGIGGVVAVPTTGVLEYSPGVTDTIGVVVANNGSHRWGFEATVLKNSDNSMAGSFNTLPDAPTLIQSSGGRSYISHTSNGAIYPFDPADGTWWGVPNGASWIFEWKAPQSGTGPVTFYVTGVAANGDEAASATDTTFTFQLTLTEKGAAVEQTTWGNLKNKYR